ncbi:MAG: DDE-type integrase/transposase/recombinase, partial [Gammaproteobacteria bacterium]|nr:DDE-type integrase/transposase/recombinase [Gammaproteobacteria bacterium]
KLIIAVQEVSLLGHILSSSPTGTLIRPDPRNASAILKLRSPSNIHEVLQFLGFCNFISQFIRDYAELTEPLHRLTRKDIPFEWDKRCQVSFEVLKARIASPEVLSTYNPNLPTILTTDASDVGLGAVLSQLNEGKEYFIAFASKTLSSTERNYSSPEREALACVWAVEYFQKYLLGIRFTLRTDQRSLLSLLSHSSCQRTSRRIARWRDRLQHFSYLVEHIPGRQNTAADMLSRFGADLEEAKSPVLPDDDDRVLIAAFSSSTSVSIQDVIQHSQTDADLSQVRDYILSNSWPSRKNVPEHLWGFFDVREELSHKDFCLFRGHRWIIPKSLHQKILHLLHSGHPGIGNMRQKYNDAYYWPGGSRDVQDYVKQCSACLASGKSSRPPKVPTTAVPPPSLPWKKLAIDIMGPFWTAPKTQHYIVVVSDYFSKFPEIHLTSSITTSSITTWLTEVFARFRLPDEIVSDNGPQFRSDEFKTFLHQRNIRHNPTAVYNPSQNGLVEVFNRSLKQQARAIAHEAGNFKLGILEFLASFRTTAP